uniref:hypothetical protein n=1 Tax=Nonomuraea pusilla TaxID=46177 RepID=UPI00128EF8B5|nr:hypothetical protein [Nonomuraea pusilla]
MATVHRLNAPGKTSSSMSDCSHQITELDIAVSFVSQYLIHESLIGKIKSCSRASTTTHRKGSWMRHGIKVASAAVLAGLIVATTATPAAADLWPFDGIPPDKSTHSYCYTSSVTTGLKSYIPGAMNYLDSATNIPGVPFHSPCETTNSETDGTPATDVAWFEVWVTDAYGEVECKVRTASNPNVCDQNHTRINSSMIKTSSNAHQQYIKTVCHELGHTTGLNHYGPLLSPPEPPGAFGQPQDCMASGDVTRIGDVTGTWTHTYNPHHIGHINPHWA